MYALDGTTAIVANSDIEAWKAVGWYDVPVSIVYAPNGTTAVIATSDVEAWKAVGWYDKNYTVMYAPDGRTAQVSLGDIEAWKAVGWFDVPVTTLYAPDGRAIVVANSDVETWKATGWFDKPVNSQPSYTIDSPATNEKGSLLNPYSASEGVSLTYQKWPNISTKNISVKCKQVMRGDAANKLAASENMFNAIPQAGQEWCFIEFDINYISSTNGSNDSLRASDIIYSDTFFTSTGNNLVIYDIATHGTNLAGYSVLDNEFYPGSSGTVIIGLLINTSVSDILLQIPNRAQSTNSWIKCN